MGFQAECRAAAVAFLTDYAQSASLGMQIYPGRPRSVNPPTGFVDAISESLDHSTMLTAREPSVEVIVIFGTYDSADTVARKDAFADGFIHWAETRYHQAAANTMIAVNDTEDLPEYVPSWLPPDQQRTYYATRISLGGFRRG